MFFALPKTLKKAGVLGMNRRNIELISQENKRTLFPLVDDKLQSKLLAAKHNIRTPKLLFVVRYQHEVKRFLEQLGDRKSFVIKPAHGSGGKGIAVIVDREGDDFIRSNGSKMSFGEIARHLSNTLSGLYSLSGDLDTAIVEALVDSDPVFENYSYQGVPDIRIIVYRGYPIMAMLRLSTKASSGRANLHQGAVGVGIDIASGKAVNAVVNGKKITHHPDTGYLLSDIVLPNWHELLLLASRSYEMTNLGYLGVDLVLERTKGAMLLELNARAGLAIQIANGSGILKKVETIRSILHKELSPKERVEFVMRGV